MICWFVFHLTWFTSSKNAPIWYADLFFIWHDLRHLRKHPFDMLICFSSTHIYFRPPNNDYTSDSLQLVKDKIFINLFDEVIIDMLVVCFFLFFLNFYFYYEVENSLTCFWYFVCRTIVSDRQISIIELKKDGLEVLKFLFRLFTLIQRFVSVYD